MTTNPPEAPDPAPTQPGPPPAPPADEAKGYAIYDLTYLKFAPGVFDKKPSRTEAKKLVGHDDFEIREV